MPKNYRYWEIPGESKKKICSDGESEKKETSKLTFSKEPADSLYNNFKQGDVIFGLSKYREAEVKKLEKKGFHHLTANALNVPAVRMVVNKKIDLKKLDESQQEYLDFLSKQDKYLTKPGGRPLAEKEANPKVGIAIRRACKRMLITSHKKRTAHVLTKNLKWDRVCDKTKSGFSVTDSEIRGAYRHYRKNGANPYIFFYDQNNIRCKPPWEDPAHQAHWRGYEAYRKKKEALKKTKKSEEMDNFIKRMFNFK